jgi:hypothetical protein
MNRWVEVARIPANIYCPVSSLASNEHSMKPKTVTICSVVVGVLLCGILAVSFRHIHRDRPLREVFGSSFKDLEIVAANDRYGFLGGGGRAWHVRFKSNDGKLPPGVAQADMSDLQFATANIRNILGGPVDALEQASVFRMDYGRHGFYFVRNGNSTNIYIYLFVN